MRGGKLMERKYSTVLFDADNTLLDFDRAEENALTRILTELGLNVTKEITERYSEINLSFWRAFERGEMTKAQLRTKRFADLFGEIGFHCPRDLDYVADTYLAYLAEGSFLLDGALYLCQRLKEEGYKVYIITNGVAVTQRKRLKRSGLDRFLDGLFVSEDIGTQKPFPEFFDFVFEHIEEKDKSKIIVVGDSYSSDIAGACGAGLDCVWFNKGKEKNINSLPVTKEIESLGELFEFFEI